MSVLCRILPEDSNGAASEANSVASLTASLGAEATGPAEVTTPPSAAHCAEESPATATELATEVPVAEPCTSAEYHPKVCKPQQFVTWQKSHHWLACYPSGAVYCLACRYCAFSGAFVAGCGAEIKSAKTLLKKIYKHEESWQHRDAVEKMALAQEKKIEVAAKLAQNIFELQNKQKIEITERVFRTVYECVKSYLPLSELSRLVQLQEANGLDIGKILTSHQSAANIAEHIANEMRSNLVSHILNSDTKISVMVDESTSVSQEQSMIVYIRTEFDGIACNYFLDCIPVTQAILLSHCMVM